jgi:phosphoglycolate phosphatase
LTDTPDHDTLQRTLCLPLNDAIDLIAPSSDAMLKGNLRERFTSYYDSNGWMGSSLFPEVSNCLKSVIRLGMRNFLVTNKRELPTLNILDELGIAGYFSAVVCRDSVSPPFTSKAQMVRYLLEAQLLNPQGSLMVGDSCDDFEAARAAGVEFLGVGYGYGSAALRLRPGTLIHSLRELQWLIRQPVLA